MIIILEGLPCSGKTTIGWSLAKKLNFNFRSYPVNLGQGSRFMDSKTEMDFGMAVDMLTHPPDPQYSWVIENYWKSHCVYGGRFTKYLKDHLPAPDFTFYLDVCLDLAIERSEQQGYTNKLTLKQLNELEFRYGQMVYTDWIPTYATPEEKVQRILTKIGR